MGMVPVCFTVSIISLIVMLVMFIKIENNKKHVLQYEVVNTEKHLIKKNNNYIMHRDINSNANKIQTCICPCELLVDQEAIF